MLQYHALFFLHKSRFGFQLVVEALVGGCCFFWGVAVVVVLGSRRDKVLSTAALVDDRESWSTSESFTASYHTPTVSAPPKATTPTPNFSPPENGFINDLLYTVLWRKCKAFNHACGTGSSVVAWRVCT